MPRLTLWPIAALASAALFGLSTPLAKLILGIGVDPWLLAGLLYAGSGVGLTLFLGLRACSGAPAGDARLRAADLPWLGLVLLFGGILGPVLLMVGLSQTSASSAALLLNAEGLGTMVIAWVVFRENVDRRLLIGAFCILAGATILSWDSRFSGAALGSAAVLGACLAWAIDNNLTRKLSSADPVQIAAIKGLVAGAANLGLAVAHGATFPSVAVTEGAGLVGLAGYGISLVLFVLSLRHLGAARTGAYFSTGPFIGAAVAIIFLHEPTSIRLLAAGVLMAVGVYLHLSEQHEHEHEHAPLEHEHRHTHDAHHQHDHAPGDPPGEPHTHRHRHAPLRHSHAHYPDLHHRHGHAR